MLHILEEVYKPDGTKKTVTKPHVYLSHDMEGVYELMEGSKVFAEVESYSLYIGATIIKSGKMSADITDGHFDTSMVEHGPPHPFLIFTQDGYVYKSMLATCKDLTENIGASDAVVYACCAGMPVLASIRALFSRLSVCDLQGMQQFAAGNGEQGTGIFVSEACLLRCLNSTDENRCAAWLMDK